MPHEFSPWYLLWSSPDRDAPMEERRLWIQDADSWTYAEVLARPINRRHTAVFAAANGSAGNAVAEAAGALSSTSSSLHQHFNSLS